MATKMATPRAKPIWRIMLITPEPVAKDDAGRADVPRPISVGSVSPTPIPDGITHSTAKARSACGPAMTAHTNHACCKDGQACRRNMDAFNRAINGPASSNDVTGTRRPVAAAEPGPPSR